MLFFLNRLLISYSNHQTFEKILYEFFILLYEIDEQEILFMDYIEQLMCHDCLLHHNQPEVEIVHKEYLRYLR